MRAYAFRLPFRRRDGPSPFPEDLGASGKGRKMTFWGRGVLSGTSTAPEAHKANRVTPGFSWETGARGQPASYESTAEGRDRRIFVLKARRQPYRLSPRISSGIARSYSASRRASSRSITTSPVPSSPMRRSASRICSTLFSSSICSSRNQWSRGRLEGSFSRTAIW